MKQEVQPCWVGVVLPRLALLALATVIVIVLLTDDAHAQGLSGLLTGDPKTGPLDQTFNGYRALADSWGSTGQKYARLIFVPLSILHLLWVGIEMAVSPGDLRSGVGRWAREFLLLSVFFMMIEWAPKLGVAAVDFFESAAQEASTQAMGAAAPTMQSLIDNSIALSAKILGTGESTPAKTDQNASAAGATGKPQQETSLVDDVVDFASTTVNQAVTLAVLSYCPWLLPALLMLFALNMAALAGMHWIAQLWGYISIGLGTIVLGAGGAVWTRFLVPNFLKVAGSGALVLYSVRFVEQIALVSIEAWINEAMAKKVLGIEVLLTMIVTTTGFTMLTLAAPALGLAMFSGQASTAAAGMAKLLPSSALGAAGALGMKNLGQWMSSAMGGGATPPKNGDTPPKSNDGPGGGGGAATLHGSGGPTPKVGHAGGGALGQSLRAAGGGGGGGEAAGSPAGTDASGGGTQGAGGVSTGGGGGGGGGRSQGGGDSSKASSSRGAHASQTSGAPDDANGDALAGGEAAADGDSQGAEGGSSDTGSVPLPAAWFAAPSTGDRAAMYATRQAGGGSASSPSTAPSARGTQQQSGGAPPQSRSTGASFGGGNAQGGGPIGGANGSPQVSAPSASGPSSSSAPGGADRGNGSGAPTSASTSNRRGGGSENAAWGGGAHSSPFGASSGAAARSSMDSNASALSEEGARAGGALSASAAHSSTSAPPSGGGAADRSSGQSPSSPATAGGGTTPSTPAASGQDTSTPPPLPSRRAVQREHAPSNPRAKTSVDQVNRALRGDAPIGRPE